MDGHVMSRRTDAFPEHARWPVLFLLVQLVRDVRQRDEISIDIVNLLWERLEIRSRYSITYCSYPGTIMTY